MKKPLGRKNKDCKVLIVFTVFISIVLGIISRQARTTGLMQSSVWLITSHYLDSIMVLEVNSSQSRNKTLWKVLRRKRPHISISFPAEYCNGRSLFRCAFSKRVRRLTLLKLWTVSFCKRLKSWCAWARVTDYSCRNFIKYWLFWICTTPPSNGKNS